MKTIVLITLKANECNSVPSMGRMYSIVAQISHSLAHCSVFVSLLLLLLLMSVVCASFFISFNRTAHFFFLLSLDMSHYFNLHIVETCKMSNKLNVIHTGKCV